MSRSRIAYGTLASLLLTATTILTSVLQLKLVVVYLDASFAGLWLLLMSLGQYVAVMDLGFGPTLSREISFALGRQQELSQARNQISSLIASVQHALLLAAMAVFCLGLPVGAMVIAKQGGNVSELLQTWILFLIGAVATLSGSISLTSLYGFGYVATERLIRSLNQFVWLGLAFVFLKIGFGIRGLAGAWLIQGIILRATAYVILHRNQNWLRSEKSRPSLDLLKKLLAPSLKWAATSLGALLILQSGNLVIGLTLTTADIPRYEAISKIAAALMTLGLAIVTASSPYLSRLVAAGDLPAVRQMIFFNVRIALSATILGAIFFGVFGADIIRVWLGPGYFAGTWTLIVMLLMVSLEVHHVILATATVASGQVPFAGTAILAGVINFTAGLVLARFLGVFGVALAIFLAQLTTNNWYAPYYTFRLYRIRISEYLRNALSPIAILSATMAFFALLLERISSAESPGPAQLFSFGLVYGLTASSLAIFILLRSEERTRLFSVLRRKKLR